MSRVHVLLALVAPVLLAAASGCGGSAAKDAPRAPAQPGGAAAPPPAYAPPATAAPRTPEAMPSPPPSRGGLEGQYRLDRAAETVEEAEAQLAALEQNLAQQLEAEAMGAGRCERACRALASMDRSASRLCELAGDEDDRCAEARERVATSARRVTDAGCGC